jgi:hypothetical protein
MRCLTGAARNLLLLRSAIGGPIDGDAAMDRQSSAGNWLASVRGFYAGRIRWCPSRAAFILVLARSASR